EREERRRDGEPRDQAVPPAGECARPRLGFVFLDELFGLVVGEDRLEIGARDDLRLDRRPGHRAPASTARSQGRSCARTRITVSPNSGFRTTRQRDVESACSPAGATPAAVTTAATSATRALFLPDTLRLRSAQCRRPTGGLRSKPKGFPTEAPTFSTRLLTCRNRSRPGGSRSANRRPPIPG